MCSLNETLGNSSQVSLPISPETWQLITMCVTIIICSICIPLNLVICVIIVKNDKLQHRINWLIMSMCFADLAFLVMMLTGTSILSKHGSTDPSELTVTLKFAYLCLAIPAWYPSSLTGIEIAISRLVALRRVNRLNKLHLTDRVWCSLIFGPWIVGFIVGWIAWDTFYDPCLNQRRVVILAYVQGSITIITAGIYAIICYLICSLSSTFPMASAIRTSRFKTVKVIVIYNLLLIILTLPHSIIAILGFVHKTVFEVPQVVDNSIAFSYFYFICVQTYNIGSAGINPFFLLLICSRLRQMVSLALRQLTGCGPYRISVRSNNNLLF